MDKGVPHELFFDAKGQSVVQVRAEMKSLGKPFAFDTTPCELYGHTLRTRAGHCIQCNPAYIGFMLRDVSFGTVYIAGSLKSQLIKVGTTTSREDRIDSLNRTKYGKIGDFETLMTCKCLHAGAFEFEIHKLLKQYMADVKYTHDNHEQRTNELFRCSFSKAREALQKAAHDLKIELIDVKEKSGRTELYKFRTLRKL